LDNRLELASDMPTFFGRLSNPNLTFGSFLSCQNTKSSVTNTISEKTNIDKIILQGPTFSASIYKSD